MKENCENESLQVVWWSSGKMSYISNGLNNLESLVKCLEPEKTKLNEPMSAHTTLGVGGEADIFYKTEISND